MKIHTGIKQAESLFKQTSALGSSIGSSSAIDTSKIIKITTIRKNLDENSSHAEVLGRIRTRMGMFFYRSSLFSFEIKVARITTAVDSRIVIVSILLLLLLLLLLLILLLLLLALQPPLGVVFYSPLAGFSLLAYEVS